MHFYTLITKYQKEIKKIIPFKNASKRTKYIGINETKEVKDPYTKNCKTLMEEKEEEMEEEINKWKAISGSWIGRIVLKCPYYPKQSTDSVQSLPKFQWHFSQK